MDRRTLTIGGVVLAVVSFVALNTWASLDLRSLRLDLTAERQFTLSDGTERLLAGIEEPITLRLYVSRSVREANPYLGTYADRVHDLLETYSSTSGGNIAVEYVDPEPYSPEEDRAVGFGLQALSLDGQDSSGYFGLAGTNSTDDVDVLPVLSPEREPFLEYDLTRMVYNLANPQKPAVAVISSLPLNGDPANQYQPWRIAEELGQFFDLRYLGGDVAKVDEDVRLLLLVHPQALSDQTLYAIDNFVLRGGEAVVFVDPHSEAQALRQQQQQQGMPGDSGSAAPRLFESWGLDLVADRVVGDPRAARQVVFPSGGRQQVVEYLPWLSIEPSGFTEGEVVTSQLSRLNFASAGILRPREGATTTFTPLVASSPDAMEIAADRVRVYPDPFAIARDFQPGGNPLAIAARVEGPAKTAFPGGKPEGAAEAPEPIAESQGPIRVAVIADTDLLEDRNWLASQGGFGQNEQVPVADNASFVANVMDSLAGSDQLIGLREGASTFRPFTRVAEIRRAAEQQYRAKEQELVQRLGDLQTKLASFQPTAAEGGGEGELVTEAQSSEVEGFRTQLLETRRELREVQLALRKDIEDLRDRVRFVNIAAVPLVIAVLALLMALVQRVRYRRRVDAATA